MTGLDLNSKFSSTAAAGDAKSSLGTFLGASLDEMFAGSAGKQAAREVLLKAAVVHAPERADAVNAYNAKHPVAGVKTAEARPSSAAAARAKPGSCI